MKVVLDTSNEVIIKVLIGWWSLRILNLHHTDQVLCYFINFVSGKQIGHLKVMR